MSLPARQLAPTDEPLRSAPADAKPPLEWSFNPWRERPWMSAVAALVSAGSVVFMMGLGLRPVVAIVLGIALAGALGPLLIPSRCRVDEAGVAYRRMLAWERRRWENIGRARPVRGGLLVSPFRNPQPLDTFRALLLPIPRDKRASLIEKLTPRLAEHDL